MKIANKLVLVTGAGSGIGRALTIELIQRGAKVAAVDLRAETLAETKKLAGGQIETFVLDVSDAAKVAALPALVAKKLGAIDVLVNNAGIIQPFVKINDLTIEQAARVMAVNFTGALMLTKAFLPALLKRPEAHILNVSSMGAYAPVPGQSVYGASKAALKLFTEGLRSELLDTNVGVTIAFPGAINTNIAQNSGMAIPANADSAASKFKMTEAPVAALAMIDAIERNRPRITIGSDATLMDRLSRLNPVLAAGIIYKQMASLLK
jgi:NAD(P)-dependent dehydrogenase (short-subunit alcohol dehydrogenase family)